MSPELAGGFLTTAPPGKSWIFDFVKFFAYRFIRVRLVIPIFLRYNFSSLSQEKRFFFAFSNLFICYIKRKLEL